MAIPFGSLLFLLLLFFLLSPSSAEIRFKSIRSSDRLIIPLDLFGFTDSGRVELNVSSFSLSNPNADLSKLAFFLTTRRSWLHVVRQLESSEIDCPLDSELVRVVFPFASLRDLNASNNVDSSFSAVYSDPGADRYHLAFVNCLPGLRVSMVVRSALYNLHIKSGRRDYLPAGTTELPRVYSLFSQVYFAIALWWMLIICKKRRSPSAIHIILFGFLILKALNLFSDAEGKSFLNSTGRAHFRDMDVYFYISFLLKLVMIVFPHGAVPTFSQIAIDETGPKALIPWEAQFLLANAIFFSVVMFAIVWWIKRLREASQTDTKAAEKLKKLESSRNFCAVMFCYLYFTALVVYALEVITSYRYLWTSVAAAELITLAFYVSIGYKCRHNLGLSPAKTICCGAVYAGVGLHSDVDKVLLGPAKS